MKNLPTELLNAFRFNPHYYVTKAGELVPLAMILAVRTFDQKPRRDLTSETARLLNKRIEATPEGSIIVTVAGSQKGFIGGEIIVPKPELPEFIAALYKLGAPRVEMS